MDMISSSMQMTYTQHDTIIVPRQPSTKRAAQHKKRVAATMPRLPASKSLLIMGARKVYKIGSTRSRHPDFLDLFALFETLNHYLIFISKSL